MEVLADIAKGLGGEVAVSGRTAAAEQEFASRISEWEFKIELQKLWREDIRDLVELTVGRMDVCHLVGALLMEFCITYFVKNSVLEHGDESVPLWAVVLFLISNATALGYLVFAVWLAMHASVASHSIGVRLLTGFARVSVPVKAQIDQMKAQVVPMGRMRQLARWMDGDPKENATWSSDQAIIVGSEGDDEHFRKNGVPLLDPHEVNSLRVAVELLNRGTAICDDGICVVWSASQQRFYALYRSDAKEAAEATFDEVTNGRKEFKFQIEYSEDWRSAFDRKLGFEAARVKAKLVDPEVASLQIFDAEGELVKEQALLGSVEKRRFPIVATFWQAAPPPPEYADPFEDDQSHFRRFVAEQQTWLRYDAYARVSMSLGVNQMLQALSYFVVGVVVKRSPTGAFVSISALMLISVMMLRLDMQPGEQSDRAVKHETGMMFLVVVCPPFLALSLVWLNPVLCGHDIGHDPQCRKNVGALATPCFIAHMLWLCYIVYIVAEHNNELPKRLRTVFYINIVEVEQVAEAKQVRFVALHSQLDLLEQAMEEVRQAMVDIQNEEAVAAIDRTRRRSPHIDNCARMLRRRLEELRTDPLCGVHDSSEDAEVIRLSLQGAERALERLELWKQAPDILEQLDALRQAKAWLPETRRVQAERTYESFLKQCRQLDLGITDSYGKAQPSKKKSIAVRVDAPTNWSNTGYGDHSAYVCPETPNNWTMEAPQDVEVTSFATLQEPVMNFTRRTMVVQSEEEQALLQQSVLDSKLQERFMLELVGANVEVEDFETGGVNFGDNDATREKISRRGTGLGEQVVHLKEAVRDQIVPEESTPPTRLPGILIHRFTVGCICVWALALAQHCCAVGGLLVDHPWVEEHEGHGEHGGQRCTGQHECPEGHTGGEAHGAGEEDAHEAGGEPPRVGSDAQQHGEGAHGAGEEEGHGASVEHDAGEGAHGASGAAEERRGASDLPGEEAHGASGARSAGGVGEVAHGASDDHGASEATHGADEEAHSASDVRSSGGSHETGSEHHGAALLSLVAQERGSTYKRSAAASAASGPRTQRITELRQLDVEWPKPRKLFEVGQLHCTASHVFVGNRFAIHAAPRRGAFIQGFQEVWDSAASSVFCEERGCSVIHGGRGAREPWLIGRLELGVDSPAKVPVGELSRIPASWRLVVAEATPAASQPSLLTLAAWDGLEVVVATAEPTAPASSSSPEERGTTRWTVRPRLAVHPRLSGSSSADDDDERGGGYGDVRALQLGDGGRTLAVLARGGTALDGWDLVGGRLLGRWNLTGGPYDAMCHDGLDLLLARRAGSAGARLASTALPQPLRSR